MHVTAAASRQAGRKGEIRCPRSSVGPSRYCHNDVGYGLCNARVPVALAATAAVLRRVQVCDAGVLCPRDPLPLTAGLQQKEPGTQLTPEEQAKLLAMLMAGMQVRPAGGAGGCRGGVLGLQEKGVARGGLCATECMWGVWGGIQAHTAGTHFPSHKLQVVCQLTNNWVCCCHGPLFPLCS